MTSTKKKEKGESTSFLVIFISLQMILSLVER